MRSPNESPGPLDAADQQVLARARALAPGPPPPPWHGPMVLPAAGGYAAGWDDAECVVLISADGYSVTNAHTGERLLRDRDAARTYAALFPDSLHFTLPHSGTVIDVFGLVGGDGIHYTSDGWHVDVIYPWYPHATALLVAPDTPEARVPYFKRASALALTRLADWEWLRSGFSPSGQHCMLVGPGGAEVYSRTTP